MPPTRNGIHNKGGKITMRKLTLRQTEVLHRLKEHGVIRGGSDGSVIWTLQLRGLVYQHIIAAPCGIYYVYTPTKEGARALKEL